MCRPCIRNVGIFWLANSNISRTENKNQANLTSQSPLWQLFCHFTLIFFSNLMIMKIKRFLPRLVHIKRWTSHKLTWIDRPRFHYTLISSSKTHIDETTLNMQIKHKHSPSPQASAMVKSINRRGCHRSSTFLLPSNSSSLFSQNCFFASPSTCSFLNCARLDGLHGLHDLHCLFMVWRSSKSCLFHGLLYGGHGSKVRNLSDANAASPSVSH